jgi:hypothetical protein
MKELGLWPIDEKGGMVRERGFEPLRVTPLNSVWGGEILLETDYLRIFDRSSSVNSMSFRILPKSPGPITSPL